MCGVSLLRLAVDYTDEATLNPLPLACEGGEGVGDGCRQCEPGCMRKQTLVFVSKSGLMVLQLLLVLI